MYKKSLDEINERIFELLDEIDNQISKLLEENQQKEYETILEKIHCQNIAE